MFPNKFSKRTIIIFLFNVSFLVLTSCVFKPTTFGVIFTKYDWIENSSDIYQIKDNNAQVTVDQLTFTPEVEEYQLLVSKDGEKIVFTTGFLELEIGSSLKQHHLYLLNKNNKEFVDITNSIIKYEQVWPDFSIDWSQDQKQFVIVTYEGEGLEIESFLELIDLDKGEKERIHVPLNDNLPSLIQTAKWSPDAKKLILTQGVIGVQQNLKNPGSAILIYDIESDNLTKLTQYNENCLPIDWSPNGLQIVVECNNINTQHSAKILQSHHIKLFNVENPEHPDQSFVYDACYDPSWSFDGNHIAFICERENAQKGIFIINSDGSGLREIKVDEWATATILESPTWSPNGTQIIYIMGTDYQHTNIFSVSIDGSKNRYLTNQEATYNIVSVYPLP